jgi:hypothetical protein
MNLLEFAGILDLEENQAVKGVQESEWSIHFRGLFETENNLKSIVGPMLGRLDKSDYCRCIDEMARGSFDD